MCNSAGEMRSVRRFKNNQVAIKDEKQFTYKDDVRGYGVMHVGGDDFLRQ